MDIVKTVTMVLSSVVYGEKYESLDAKNLKDRLRYHTLVMDGLNPTHPINLFPWLWNIPSPWKTKVLQMIKVGNILSRGNDTSFRLLGFFDLHSGI